MKKITPVLEDEILQEAINGRLGKYAQSIGRENMKLRRENYKEELKEKEIQKRVKDELEQMAKDSNEKLRQWRKEGLI